MKPLAFAISIALALSLAPTAWALDSFECGHYVLIGRWAAQGAFRTQLVLYAGAKSEQRIGLTGVTEKDRILHGGRLVELEVKVTKPFSGGGGEASLEKVIRHVSPIELAKRVNPELVPKQVVLKSRDSCEPKK